MKQGQKAIRFKDLEFKPHGVYKGGFHAIATLTDGTRISVIYGADGMYCGEGTYEMMSERVKAFGGVRGHMTKEQIDRHLVYCQKHPLK